MRGSGMSVPEMVREIISRNRSIYDCMRMDLINYTALAVRIQPEIEGIAGGPVNLNTIVVAIKRYADTFEADVDADEEPVLRNARLALTDGMVDIKVSMREPGVDPADILDKFSKITDDYDFIRMPDSFRFLAEDVEDIRRIFDGVPDRGDMFSSGLAKIRISIPGDRNRSDVVSYVAEILHVNGIELENAFFGTDGITIILGGGDAARAYDVLRSSILR